LIDRFLLIVGAYKDIYHVRESTARPNKTSETGKTGETGETGNKVSRLTSSVTLSVMLFIVSLIGY